MCTPAPREAAPCDPSSLSRCAAPAVPEDGDGARESPHRGCVRPGPWAKEVVISPQNIVSAGEKAGQVLL